MRTILLCLLAFTTALASARAGEMDRESQEKSPSGMYVFDRLEGPKGDHVLYKTKPRRTMLQGLTLEGGDCRWPYYKITWSKSERYFALEWIIRKESDICVYRIDDDKITEIKLPDFDKLITPKEMALGKKAGLKEMRADSRWTDQVEFVKNDLLTFHFWSWYNDGNNEFVDYVNAFKLRIKGDKTVIVSYELNHKPAASTP